MTDKVTSTNAESAPTRAKAALVFVSGINRSRADESLRDLADDITVSLDRRTKGLTFTVAPADSVEQLYAGDPMLALPATTQRTSGQREAPAAPGTRGTRI